VVLFVGVTFLEPFRISHDADPMACPLLVRDHGERRIFAAGNADRIELFKRDPTPAIIIARERKVNRRQRGAVVDDRGLYGVSL